jgi:RimJ/RimL family protein N-acetyltransferase
MFFRSERLFLRPGFAEDWQDLRDAIADAAIVRNLATAPWPYREEDARLFAARVQDPRYPHFLLTLPTDQGAALVGSAGLGEREGEAELGYWIARPFWGQGFATEAASAVLEIARMLGHRRVIAGHHHDNPASGSVLRKAGFRPTGAVERRYCLGRGASVPGPVYAIAFDDGDGTVELDIEMPAAA